MMRIRTVKPEFWAHRVMSKLDYPVRLLALALLNYSDDFGYFEADPILIRGSVMPREESTNVRRWIDELSRVGWIDLYDCQIDGQNVAIGAVRGFSDHQRVDRPKPSKWQDFCSTKNRRCVDDASTNDRRRNREQGTGKGRGGESRPQINVSRARARPPEDDDKPDWA